MYGLKLYRMAVFFEEPGNSSLPPIVERNLVKFEPGISSGSFPIVRLIHATMWGIDCDSAINQIIL